MLKANGRVAKNSYSEANKEIKIERFKNLLKLFKENGEDFEYFKTTSSYIEIPPQNASDDSSTYIIREFRGVQFITLGHTIYYINNLDFQCKLNKNPEWNLLGGTNIEIIRAEACYVYMNAEGRLFHMELMKLWEELTKPFMVFRGY